MRCDYLLLAALLSACSSVPFESTDTRWAWTEIIDDVELTEPPDGERATCYPLRASAGPLESSVSGFDRPFGVVVAGGTCSMTGYSLEVRRLVSKDGLLEIHAELREPRIGGMLTSPISGDAVLAEDDGWDRVQLIVRHVGM